jgi:CDP-diacylglycerol--glycerol-3-phosphate 3-phosphatidyltransferase
VVNVPNALSCIRLSFVPVLLVLAWNGHHKAFLICLMVSIFTDAADGWLARRLNQTTELGAKLDSWSDFATWLCLPFCAWWLRPEVIRQEATFLALAIFFYIAAIVFGFLKYGRLTSYHTWASKGLAILVAAAALVFFANGAAWPLRVIVPMVVLSQIEEMCITALLPEWRTNVPSIWHAWKFKTSSTAR